MPRLTPANTITAPSGFNPLSPGTIFAALPKKGTDQPVVALAAQHVIGPLLIQERWEARSRSRMRVLGFDIPLDCGTDQISAATKTRCEAEIIVSILVDITNVQLQAVSPVITTGVSIKVDSSNIVTAAESPFIIGSFSAAVPFAQISLIPSAVVVSSGSSVAVPCIEVALTAHVPNQAGTDQPVTQVVVPTSDFSVGVGVPAVATGASVASALVGINVAAESVTVATGTSVAVPVTDMALAAAAPSVSITANDPYFSNVSLLLHMDGTDGSTTFTDVSSNANAITVYADAQVDVSQSKYGGASALFDGSGDYLRGSSNSTMALGAGDFTIETWVRFANVSGAQSLIAWGNSPILAKNASRYFYATFGSTVTSTSLAAPDTWYHVAVVRSSGVTSLYINGTSEGTPVSNTTDFTATSPYIGRRGDTTFPYYLNGWLDELRITKGVARYTANFTVPSTPFPDQ